MQNLVQDGRIIGLVAPVDVLPGKIVNVGQIVGVAQNKAATGDIVQTFMQGVFEGLPLTGTAPAVGDKLYYDSSAQALTKTASGNVPAGHFIGNGLVRLHSN